MLYRPRRGTDFKDSLKHAVEVNSIEDIAKVIDCAPENVIFTYFGKDRDPWCTWLVSEKTTKYPYGCASGYVNENPELLIGVKQWSE